MHPFIVHLFGEDSLTLTLSCLFYAYLAAFASLLMHTTKRNVYSVRTPFTFSFSFLFTDNAKRIVANIILIFLGVRFSKQFIGLETTQWTAVLIGFGFDRLAQWLKALSNSSAKQHPCHSSKT